jgi:non-ribosomal peptide synthetase-like protein
MMLGTFLVTSTLAAILPVLAVLALFPIVLLASQFTALFMAVGVKLLAIGRYRPTVSPLWSMFVWRSELVTGVYEGPAAQVLLLALTGTPFIRSLWRLFGVKVGKRVFVDTTHVTEFDLVRIDDEAALNLNCGAQTHLFEDRVMKMSFLHIGPGCSVGSNSIVLYDTTMHPGSKLGSLSLLMKGESLPAQTQWAGIPAQRVVARAGSVAP